MMTTTTTRRQTYCSGCHRFFETAQGQDKESVNKCLYCLLPRSCQECGVNLLTNHKTGHLTWTEPGPLCGPCMVDLMGEDKVREMGVYVHGRDSLARKASFRSPGTKRSFPFLGRRAAP